MASLDQAQAEVVAGVLANAAQFQASGDLKHNI